METNGRVLVSFVRQLPGMLHLCLEEGEWSQWLFQVLSPHVKEMVVVWPERRDSAKSDALDARHLREGSMRIGDLLYFAPRIRFDHVDLDGPGLPEQFRQRIEGFYLVPAEECAERHHAFAAGVLLVSCMDALARLRFGNGVGERFKTFAREQLKSFASGDLAERFYLEFRNGLVHEARLKEGGQFSLDIGSTVEELQGLLLVNPRLLAVEVRSALDDYMAVLHREAKDLANLAQALRQDHAKDFLVARASRAAEQGDGG